jgi:hypothetical protein
MSTTQRKWLAGILCVAVSAFGARSALATVVYSTGTVSWFSTYSSFGGGDITFRLTNQPSSCSGGYWMSKSQAGFNANLAYLLAARAAGETIVVGGDDAVIWNGSASIFCRVEWIHSP